MTLVEADAPEREDVNNKYGFKFIFDRFNKLKIFIKYDPMRSLKSLFMRPALSYSNRYISTSSLDT